MRFAAVLVLSLVAVVPARARASCIGGVVGQVGAALHPNDVPAGALVVAAPLESDVAPLAGKGDELALRVAGLVAGKIPGARVSPRTASLDDARAIASRSSRLVYVRVAIQKSQLRVTVDAYPVVRNIWDRARLPPPPPSAHAYASAPIDAEVRAFLPTIPLVLSSVYKASGAEDGVLAAACGDLDGDGAPEILLVSREHVSLARVRGNKLALERSVAWSALAPRAPVPLREPLAGAAIETGRALVGTTDRGAIALGDALDAPHPLPGGMPIGAGMCAPVSTSRLAFEGTRPCDSTANGSREPFDDAAAFDLVAPDGHEELALATSEDGKLRVRVGGADKASFDDAGAQVAAFDADLDGTLEVAFSSNAADDSITIASIGVDGSAEGGTSQTKTVRAPRVVSKIPAPAGVRALAACPPMAGGAGAIVAVVGNEVWLVR